MENYICKDQDGNLLLSVEQMSEAELSKDPLFTHCLAVVKVGNEYLLGRNKWRNRYEIFGGCAEKEETARECIVRECGEELGFTAEGITYSAGESCQKLQNKRTGVIRKGGQMMTEKAKALYLLNGYEFHPIPGHEGGRNLVYVCSLNGEKRYVLRISALGDRTEEDYLAETEFIRYLARNGAPVADVIPSVSGKLLECIEQDGNRVYISLFEYAKGMLLSDNGYRYREGAPLEEYFYNTGKALGKIHRLSKQFKPVHRRTSFPEKYTCEYIDRLIPESYAELKQAILRRLETYKTLSTNPEDYGLVHFDFCDGNYHVDLQTGDITVFDFDNCIYCWYMFDLAHLWTHGVGWYRHEPNPKKRMKYMDHYFGTILEGYRSETDVPEEMLGKLTLFIDMTIIEYVTDEFECSAREGELPEEEDIGNAAYCLIHDIPYGGFGGTRNE